MFKIYMYTNTINNKKYIGQTKRSLKLRSGKDGVLYKESTHFYSAISKYGWNNFSVSILEDNIPDVFSANEREEYYISLYKSDNPLFGYNIQSGGNNMITKEETKKKIGKGVVSSKKFHENNRKSHCKKIIAINIKTKEKICFNSITEASKTLSISRTNIGSCCNNRQHNNSAGGYIWLFEKDFIDIESHLKIFLTKDKERYSDKRNKKISNSIKSKNINRDYLKKKVMKFTKDDTFIKTYDSITSAAKDCNIAGTSNIREVCDGKRKSAGGFIWKWYDSSSETIGDECNRVANAKRDAL